MTLAPNNNLFCYPAAQAVEKYGASVGAGKWLGRHTLNRCNRFCARRSGVLWLSLSSSTMIYYDWHYDWLLW